MKKLLLALGFFLLGNALYAQRNIPAALENRLRGKTKVTEIMQEVNQYYDYGKRNVFDENGKEQEWEDNDYDWWKKWEYWAIRRLNPDGTLANHRTRNYQAEQQVAQKFGPVLQTARDNFRSSNYIPDEFRTAPDPNAPNLSYGGWVKLGPFDGGSIVGSGVNIDIVGQARIDRISFHPTNASIMYVGSPSGSVYKTTNAGTSWDDIGKGLPLGVACLQVAPSNGNVIYVFSGDGDSHRSNTFVFSYLVSPISQGMYKSTNGGITWAKCTDMYTGSNDLVGHQIAVAQNNSNIVMVATDQGLYRTTNGGNSWTQVRAGNYYDVEFRPFDDNTVYASTATTIEYSTNSGIAGSWSTSTLSPAPSITPQRIDLAVRKNTAGAQSTFVYALLSGASTGSFSGIYRSTDIGVTYDRQSNTPNILGQSKTGSDNSIQARYNLGICVKPTDANYIVTAGLNVWRSSTSNGGTAMEYSSVYREGFGTASEYIHPDVHDVQYNPLNGILYACTDGGVYRSTDHGVSWTNISSGLVGTQFYHMKMRDADGDGEMEPAEMIAGSQDNGVKYRTSGGAWRHILCCDGYDGVIKGSTAGYGLMTFNGGKYRTPDGGVTMVSEGSATSFSPVAIDYNNDDTMYVASSSLQRSYDGGQTYTNLTENVNNFITTCPSNSARLYGGSSTKTNVKRSDDRGATWTIKSGNTGWPAGSPIVTTCKPRFTNSLEVFVAFAGYNAGVKVYRSTNGGDSWSNFSGSLPNVPVHSLCVASEGVYAGTEIGVFFRPNGAADWVPFYTGMPTALVTDIWVTEVGTVYLSTFGHGVWFANRYSACPASITVSGNLDGQHYYEANSTANVSANSSGGTGTDIFVKSNGYVDLTEGFEVKSGTFFKAYLGPCGGGIPTTNKANPGTDSNKSDGANIIEYSIKRQQAARKQDITYYSIQNDGIEVNLPNSMPLTVKAINTVTKKEVLLYESKNLMQGMYKILTGEGNFLITVSSGGKEFQKL